MGEAEKSQKIELAISRLAMAPACLARSVRPGGDQSVHDGGVMTIHDADHLHDLLSPREDGLRLACNLAAAYRAAWLARRDLERAGSKQRIELAENRLNSAMDEIRLLEREGEFSWR